MVMACLLLATHIGAGSVISGKVVNVHDGDTLTVLVDQKTVKVRLDGVDSPELGQDYGKKAKQALSDAVFGKQVAVRVTATDRYGRTVGVVVCGDVDVNLMLVANGWAWQYLKYNRSRDLGQAQQEAKRKRIGLWAGMNPVAPWEYRADQRRQRMVRAGKLQDGTYWLNTSSNTRHNSTCKWYEATKRGRRCGAGDGDPCGDCGG